MAMDAAAPALKRKDAGAPELWLDDGGAADLGFVPVSSRATKIRRLDAEVPPVVPGVFVPPPTMQQQQQPVAREVRMFGDQVPVGVAAPAAAKRKGEDAPELWLDVDDGAVASGFPVSSRATKIRRLDAAELAPFVPKLCVPPPPQQQVAGLGAAEVGMCGDEVPVIVAAAPNEERAIVLYKPADAARNLLLGPLRPEVPLRVSPDWIHGLKSTVLREASEHRALFEELACRDESSNSNLAMVPWVPVPSTSPEASTSATAAATMATEMMDADQDTSMEVEQDGGETTNLAAAAGVALSGEAPYHHLPQHHCMMQQEHQPLPATASYHQPSPVTWSW